MGFKEIRYAVDKDDRTLDFLLDCFPRTQVIVLVREPFPTIFSMLSVWFSADELPAGRQIDKMDSEILLWARHWAKQYRNLHQFADKYPSQTLCIDYKDLRETETYRRLKQFLNAKLSFNYQSLLQTRFYAADKTGYRAHLIRSRLEALRPEVLEITRETAAMYNCVIAAQLTEISRT